MNFDSDLRSSEQVAIACGDAKQPALFFDKVIPLTESGSVPEAVRLKLPENVIKVGSTILQVLIDLRRQGKKEVTMEEVYLVDNLLAQKVQAFLNEKAVPSVPFFHRLQQYSHFQQSGSNQAVEVRLSNIPIIDTSKMDWEQILEIRRDEDAKAKLRRFRLFLSDNYKDKDEGYIKDSLLQKIYDYERACKKHGLELVLSTASKLLDSKSLLGTLGIATAATLLGQPIVASVGLISGAAIEIGKSVIHIAEKRLEFKSQFENSEIAYLIEIQERTRDTD